MPSRKLIILIPPSEGKQSGGHLPPLRKITPQVRRMIKCLQSVKVDEWEKLLGVKGKTLEQAIAANQSVLIAKTMPAIERYTGVLYNGLDYPSLSPKEQQYIKRHVRIVSALFGLVEPDQAIPDYKLKIDKLGADKYWKPLIGELVQDSTVIDLLPKAHQKAVDYTDGCCPEFVFIKDGKRKPAGHQGKHIKGRFIRFLAENQVTGPAAFSQFCEDGFRYVDGNFVKKV